MSEMTTDNVRVLSVESVKDKGLGDCLKVRIALVKIDNAGSEEIRLETTRLVPRRYWDEADAITVVRNWFIRLCEDGAAAMAPFRLSNEQLAALSKKN